MTRDGIESPADRKNSNCTHPQRWLKRPTHRGTHTTVNWCDADERGVFSLMYRLGQSAQVNTDRSRFSDHRIMSDHSQHPMHESWPNHSVQIRQSGQDRITLVIFHESTPDHTDTDHSRYEPQRGHKIRIRQPKARSRLRTHTATSCR